MASALRHELPSVVFEQPNELAEVHPAIVPGLSAGPRADESGEVERRAADENIAGRVCSCPAIFRVPAAAGNLCGARRQTLVQLDDGRLAALDDRAAASGRSRSDLVREAIDLLLGTGDAAAIDAAIVRGYDRVPPSGNDPRARLPPSGPNAGSAKRNLVGRAPGRRPPSPFSFSHARRRSRC